jgi:hypothetical protein
MALTKLDRNRIYKAIASSSLSPTEFELEDTETLATITHNLGSTFKFRTDKTRDRNYEIEFNIVDGGSEDFTATNLSQVATHIQSWANQVALAAAADHWEEMRRRREAVSVIEAPEAENTQFTEDERRQITAQIGKVKKHVREQFELTSAQLERIDEKLDEVAEASKRMGRKDWFVFLLGTITALIITATVTAGVGGHILNMVIQGIAHLFTGGNEPPQILT